MKKILAIDPSGNFTEGRGKTGFVMLWHENKPDDVYKFGTISAENFATRVEYWADIAILIAEEKPDILVVEDYRLYNTAATGAAVQSFSQMETPRLLGIIEQTAVMNQIPVVFQMASQTKPYTDDKLEKLGILKKEKNRWWFRGQAINDHQRSALRHLLRFLDSKSNLGKL